MSAVSQLFSRKKATRPAPLSALDGEEEESRYRPIEWPLIRRLLQTLRPYRRQYALGIGLGVIMIVLDMQSPQFIRWIVNFVEGYRAGLRPDITSHAQAVLHVAWIVAAWAAVVAASLILHRFVILIMTGAGERVQFALCDCLDKIIDERLARDVSCFCGGTYAPDLSANSLKQVCLAQPGGTVYEQRVVQRTRLRRHCHTSGVSQAVGGSNHELIKRVINA